MEIHEPLSRHYFLFTVLKDQFEFLKIKACEDVDRLGNSRFLLSSTHTYVYVAKIEGYHA